MSKSIFAAGAVLAVAAALVLAQNTLPKENAMPQTSIRLAAPKTEGGMPLFAALQSRHSSRAYDPARDLSPEQLSQLLWSAWGLNRKDGRRTAPSTRNNQSIELYVVDRTGVYAYDAAAHALNKVADGDHRAETGMQPFAGDASLNILFVGDTAKFADIPHDKALVYFGADIGHISENIDLFCASEGLATVERGSFDPARIASFLPLPATKKVMKTQSVGFAPAAK